MHRNDVPRVIGRGGATIQQIQRDQNVQIRFSNDRQAEWIDMTMSGANEQLIDRAWNEIRRYTSNIKDKTSFDQRSQLFSPFVSLCFLIDSVFRSFRFELRKSDNN